MPAADSGVYLVNSAITSIYSIVALVVAAALLKRTWREDSDRLAAWIPSNGVPFLYFLSRGSRRWHERLRARWLERSPFCWLAARNRLPVVTAKFVVTFVAAGWLLNTLMFGGKWLTPVNAFLTSVVVHQVLNLTLAYAAARPLGEARENGGLESLMTTPLGIAKILDGQRRAVAVQFGTVLVATYLLEALLFAGAAITSGSSIATSVIYLALCMMALCVWAAVHLYSVGRAVWIGLWTGRPAFAAMKTAANALFLGVVMTQLFVAGIANASAVTTIMLVLMLVLVFCLMLSAAGRMRAKLERELRWIAVAPLPARDDPRFKSWDPMKIFPPDVGEQ